MTLSLGTILVIVRSIELYPWTYKINRTDVLSSDQRWVKTQSTHPGFNPKRLVQPITALPKIVGKMGG